MRNVLLIIFLFKFSMLSFSQKADTAGAFTLLEKYCYGIPVKKNFSSWEAKIKNDDNYTYSNKEYKKLGIVLSNLISLDNHNTFGKSVDSVLFLCQNTTLTNKQNKEKENLNNLQVYLTFKSNTKKNKVDSIFKVIETEMSTYFDEENINKNKFTNGTKIMYSLNPDHVIYPIILQKYIDETTQRFVIDIFITKRKDYYTIPFEETE